MSFMKDAELVDGEYFLTVKGLKIFSNRMVKMGICDDVERCVATIQKFNTHCGIDQQIVLCTHCANMIGIKRCSACPRTSEVRYCGRDCQLADWPLHKKICSKKNVKM